MKVHVFLHLPDVYKGEGLVSKRYMSFEAWKT